MNVAACGCFLTCRPSSLTCQVVCIMCEAIDEEAPEEEMDVEGMVELLRSMNSAAASRLQKAAEERARAAEELRLAAEAAEEERLRIKAEREEKIAAGLNPDSEVEDTPSPYGGFSWAAVSCHIEQRGMDAVQHVPRGLRTT